MPVFSGTLTASWYRVGRPCPPDARERFDRPLARHAFKPINADKGEKQSAGWVDPRDILATSIHWDQLSVGPYLFLGLRVDRKSISPVLLKAHLRRELRKLAKEKKGVRLGKTEKKLLAEKIQADLLRQASPSVVVHEAVWNTATGDVFFATASQKTNEEFSELFAATFDTELFPHFPLARIKELADEAGLTEGLVELQPAYWGSGPRAIHHDPNGDSNYGEED